MTSREGVKPPKTINDDDDDKASFYIFWIFLNFRGSFLVFFLVFENFKIVIRIRMSTFGGSVFYNLLIGVLLIGVFVGLVLLFTRLA